MSTDDLEINLVQVPIKENPKKSQLKQKTTKLKKSKITKVSQARQTRSKKQDDQDDDVIIIGSFKPSPVPLSRKTISKRCLKKKYQQKQHKISSKQKSKTKNSSIKNLVIEWQKDLRKILDSTIVLSKKISQLE